MKTETEKRESREFWAVTDDSRGVAFVTGYSCAPENPNLWWVPKLGYTLSEEHHLYPTEKEAIDKALENLHFEIGEANQILSKLEKRLGKIK